MLPLGQHPQAQVLAASAPGPAAAPVEPLHTTSDLLRLLPAEARPFGELAAAVAQRFGGGPDSQAWLACTLTTLLRDGLLYTPAEKLNAAYLLHTCASELHGAQEALLHLSLPGSGEPPAVQAWAASLAAASQGVPPLLHQLTPQQVLVGALPPTGAQQQPQAQQQQPPLPWHPAPGSPLAAGHFAALGLQQQQQQQQPWLVSSTVHASSPAGGGSPLSGPAGSPLAYRQQQPAQQQQEAAAQRQAEVQGLAELLQHAARDPLVPATQQRLVMALRDSQLSAALTAPLAAAVGGGDGGGGGAGEGLQPHHMQGLVQHNSPVAPELLLALLRRRPEAAAVYAAAVAELPMSAQSVECLSAVVAQAELPDWVLATFLSNCMQDTNSCQDAGRQSRQVKLLSACVELVLRRQPLALGEVLPELQAFCIQQSRYKQASELYRQLRDLELAAS